MLKVRKDAGIAKEDVIRRQFDEKTSAWYFSIVDVIEIITETSDARNYWKVLKNRLNKTRNELVTKCNQLKMKARDGKSYLTDVADPQTVVEIIDLVSEGDVSAWKAYFRNFTENPAAEREDDLGAELPVDVYRKDGFVFVEAMAPGASPENVHIYVFPKRLVIRGVRANDFRASEHEYHLQELFWGNFSRVVPLAVRVRTDGFERTHEGGRLVIRLMPAEGNDAV